MGEIYEGGEERWEKIDSPIHIIKVTSKIFKPFYKNLF
jgi:hypothetical protein